MKSDNNDQTKLLDLLDIEAQNLKTSLEMFDLVKEISEEYSQYIKKYKEYTSQYLEKISKLSLKEIKNKNINITPIFSILNKVPQLIELQVEGLKKFIDSFDIVLKQLEEILNKEMNSLEDPKKSFEENKKKYKNNQVNNEKLKSSLFSLEKKLIKYQLSKNEKEIENLNLCINETKNIEKKYLNINKDEENYHQVFQEEVLYSIDKIKLHIKTILENLNNNVIFFLGFFYECYSPTVKYIQEEIEKNQKDPLNTQKFVNDNLSIKIFELNEFPSDKYNIKMLDKLDLDILLYNDDIEDIEIKDDALKKNFIFKTKKNNNKNDDDNISKLNIIDVLEIIKKLYFNFKMINRDKYDINIEEEKIEVKNLVDKFLLMKITKNKKNAIEENISDNEKQKLFLLIEKKENIIIFLRRLNKIRTYGNFEYQKNIFDDIVKIFFKILDIIQIEKDIFSFQLSIILSQTFYFVEGKEKIYIYKYTKSHNIYQSEEMWRNSIEYFINKEKEKYNEIISNKRNKGTKNAFNEMIFSQLMTILNNMLEFGFNIYKTEEIIIENMNKYNINENLKNIIITIIENKKNKNMNKEKESIIKEKNVNDSEKNIKKEKNNDINEEKFMKEDKNYPLET